jgi:hypothetical protein
MVTMFEAIKEQISGIAQPSTSIEIPPDEPPAAETDELL